MTYYLQKLRTDIIEDTFLALYIKLGWKGLSQISQTDIIILH